MKSFILYTLGAFVVIAGIMILIGGLFLGVRHDSTVVVMPPPVLPATVSNAPAPSPTAP